MPKQTFFNLPEDKQTKLIEAGFQEFSNASLREAKIANIINSAQIPRGSFYQYFEDIEDLFFYLVDIVIHEIEAFTVDLSLDQHLEDELRKYSHHYIQFMLESKYVEFLKQIFLNLNYSVMNRIFEASRWINRPNRPEDVLVMHYLKRYLKVESTQETKEFLITFHFNLTNIISVAVAKDWGLEKTLTKFDQRMDWLLYGVLNQESRDK